MHRLSDFLCFLNIVQNWKSSNNNCIVKNRKTLHRTGIAHPYIGVIKAKCPVFIMRLLSAFLVLLNFAYHDACGYTPGPPACPGHSGSACGSGKHILAQMGIMGQMGQMGHLGQMGQMLRRNGKVFQTLPIKKIPIFFRFLIFSN